MNAHLKLSPNPFTIDAVQSGRYLHMHMSIECVLAVLQPTTYNLQPTTPSACSSPFFQARAICLCLSWLRQHDYTHTHWARCEGYTGLFSLQPSLARTSLTYRVSLARDTTITKPARRRRRHSNRIVIIAKPAASPKHKPKLTYQVKQFGKDRWKSAI